MCWLDTLRRSVENLGERFPEDAIRCGIRVLAFGEVAKCDGGEASAESSHSSIVFLFTNKVASTKISLPAYFRPSLLRSFGARDAEESRTVLVVFGP